MQTSMVELSELPEAEFRRCMRFGCLSLCLCGCADRPPMRSANFEFSALPLGIRLCETSDGVVVHSLQPGSVAFKMGVPVRARLLSISGVSVQGKGESEVTAAIGLASCPFTLCFEKGRHSLPPPPPPAGATAMGAPPCAQEQHSAALSSHRALQPEDQTHSEEQTIGMPLRDEDCSGPCDLKKCMCKAF